MIWLALLLNCYAFGVESASSASSSASPAAPVNPLPTAPPDSLITQQALAQQALRYDRQSIDDVLHIGTLLTNYTATEHTNTYNDACSGLDKLPVPYKHRAVKCFMHDDWHALGLVFSNNLSAWDHLQLAGPKGGVIGGIGGMILLPLTAFGGIAGCMVGCGTAAYASKYRNTQPGLAETCASKYEKALYYKLAAYCFEMAWQKASKYSTSTPVWQRRHAVALLQDAALLDDGSSTTPDASYYYKCMKTIRDLKYYLFSV